MFPLRRENNNSPFRIYDVKVRKHIDFEGYLEDIFGGRGNVSSRMKLRIKIVLAKCQFLSLVSCHVSMTIRREWNKIIIKIKRKNVPLFKYISELILNSSLKREREREKNGTWNVKSIGAFFERAC